MRESARQNNLAPPLPRQYRPMLTCLGETAGYAIIAAHSCRVRALMKLRLSLVAATFALAGCAQNPTTPSLAPATPPTNLPPITYNAETLGDLLVAEDAAQRQALDITLAYYSKAALTTHDPRVMEEAAKLATYLDDPQQAQTLSSLWLKREPDNQDALRLAALAEVALGDNEAATGHIDRLIATQGGKALLPLVTEARHLDDQGNKELLTVLAGLADRYPQQAPLWYARALSERESGNTSAALEAINQALDAQPDHIEAQLLKAQLMFDQGHSEQALRYLDARVDDHPDSRRLRLAYIRLLLATGNADEAKNQLRTLAQRNPEDQDLQYSLALTALDSDTPKAAEDILNKLLKQGYRPNEVLLRLAQAAEMRNDPDAAIDYYMRVRGGGQLHAQVQAAQLMYATGRSAEGHALITKLVNANPDQADALVVSEATMRTRSGDADGALALLDQSLQTDPDNVDLLYARAMTAAALHQYDQMERDLSRVLDIKPNDAAALNALGYTWADQGIHLHKARDMIQRALQQQPDDPAFLDSMGWVLYRLGQLDDAEKYLTRALNSYPDAEVAAHLGEVLWMNGKKDKARQVWQAGLKVSPDATSIKDTMKRLEAGF